MKHLIAGAHSGAKRAHVTRCAPRLCSVQSSAWCESMSAAITRGKMRERHIDIGFAELMIGRIH